MRSGDWQRALLIPLTILAWLAVFVIAAWLLTHVIKTILTLVLSGILAFALTPLVKRLSTFMPRPVAIGIAYFAGLAVILGAGALIVYTAAEQVTNLVNNLPIYSHKVQQLEPQAIHLFGRFGMTHAKFVQTQRQVTDYIQSVGTGVAKDTLGIITMIFGTMVDIVLILILSIYLTADGHRIAQWLREQMPIGTRSQISFLIGVVNQVVGGYIRGTLTLALLIGSLVGVGMFILHVNYAVLLGVLAFFMEFIPVIGVFVSGGVCLLVALFQGWVLALVVLGYFIVVHIIEGDVVGPRIMGRAVGIHPATALVALVAGTELFGIWGALFASPLAGLFQAFVAAALREIRGGEPVEVAKAIMHKVEGQVSDPAPDQNATDSTLPRSATGAHAVPRLRDQ